MKTLHLLCARNLPAALTAALLVCQSAHAATQYAAGSITWDNSSTAAWSAISGGPYSAVWTSGNDAVFEGLADTVTLASPTAHNLTFNTTGYILSGATTLTLSGTAPTITTGTDISATISSVVGGTTGLTKAGAGTLTLNGANSYTGGTILSEGLLVLGGSNGSINDPLTIYPGAILTLDNTTTYKTNRLGNGETVASYGGVLNYNINTSSGSYAESIGALTLYPGALTVNTTQALTGQTSTLTFASLTRNPGGNALFSGTGLGTDSRNKVTFTSAPTLTAGIIPGVLIYNGSTYDLGALSGNNLTKYTAYTTGAGSTWTADTINARPSASTDTASGVTFNSLVLDSGKNVISGTIRSMTIGNASAGTPGLVVQTGGVSSFGTTSTRVTLAFGTREAIFNIASGGHLIINGQAANAIMTGSGGTTKSGPGTLTLGSDSSGGGTFTQGAMTGALNLNDGLYEVFCASNNGLAFNDVGIKFNGGHLQINTDGAAINFNKTSPNVPIIVNADGSFTLDIRSTASAFAGAAYTFGTLTVNNNANFTVTAGTHVASGTQQLTVGATTLNSDATFTLNNSAAAVMQLSAGAMATNGNTLTLKGNGKLIQTGVCSGSGGLTLDPSFTGMATLNQINTFTGATTINGGTLKLSAGTVLATSTNVSIGSGGTLDLTAVSGTYTWPASLSASGTSAAAAIAGASGGTISMGSKPISLTYDGFNPSLTVTGATLSLGGNQFTVVVPDTALRTGTYILVAASAITGTVNATPLYTGGNGLASGATGVVSISGSNVILTVSGGDAIYTVTYDGNGNTSGAAPTDVNSPYDVDAMVTLMTNSGALAKTDYTFSGWNTKADGTGIDYAASDAETLTMGSANLILYAKWLSLTTYTVTYYGNSNTGGVVPVDGTSYLNGASVTVLSNTGALTKTGFILAGWNTAADGSGTNYAASGSAVLTMGSANVSLYAKWSVPYTVTYNGNSSTGGVVPVDNSTYATGATVTVLANTGTLTKSGFIFAGWNTASNGSGTSYAATGSATFAMGSANVTLYAQWATAYTVTYNGNGNIGGAVPVDSATYMTGAAVTVLSNTGTLTKTGSTLIAWNTVANGSGTSYAVTGSAILTMGSANVTLYAQWSTAYTVTYNGNTSTGGMVPVDSGAYAAGATVTVLANTGSLTKTGFAFTGWNTAANGSGTSYAATGSANMTMGSANVTLYAQWVVAYTVTYNGNTNTGGTVPTDSGVYAAGSSVTVKSNTGSLTKTGSTLSGWNTAANGSGTSYAATGSATFAIGSANVTLYAQWAVPYTVTYNGNGNTGGAVPTDSATYAVGATVTVLSNTGTLTKTNSTFTGWNTAANGSGTSYAASGSATLTMASANVILYAQWTSSFTVTYNGNGNTGGTVPTDSATYATGASFTVKANTGALTKTSNALTGWNTAADGSGISYAATGSATCIMGSANVTLYAQWATPHTVTYNGNGNTSGTVPVDAGTYVNGASVTVKANTGTLAQTGGTTLVCWNTAADGSGTGYAASGCEIFTMGSANVTLYAQWGVVGDYTYTIDHSKIIITRYNGTGGAVSIPSTLNDLPVISIGISAFYNVLTPTSVTSVIIPNGVTSIADRAFINCKGMTSVTIPSSVTSIGNSAFQLCIKLTSVTIPSGVTSIGESTFDGCLVLASVTIPSTVTSIGDWAFNKCSFTSVTIPANVTRIGSWAFKDCSRLTAVTIPSGMTSIADGVFAGCAGLTNVTIPANVTSIGDGAFTGCAGLTAVTIPSTVTSIGSWAFAGCAKLTGVSIPSSVTTVGEGAFDSCSLLASVTLPNSITSIGSGAFDECAALSGVTLPNTITSIEDWTFASCAKLASVTLPNSVTRVGKGAFDVCAGLTDITLGTGLTSIDGWAFKSCTKLNGVTMPAGLTSIGTWTFASCTGLTSMTLPATITSIGDGAFSSCTGLTSMTIPDGVTRIADWTFYACSNLASVTLPSGLTSIGEGAFKLCPKLTSITVPESVANIGDSAFASCSTLTSAYFSGNAPSLGGSLVFSGDSTTVYYLSWTTGWDTTYGGRPTVVWPLTAQTISFTPPSSVAKSAGTLSLTGTASSGLTVSYTSSVPAIASVSGATLTLHRAGTVTITATQAGNGSYYAAPAVQRTLVVTGFVVANDAVTRPANSASIKIPISTLLDDDVYVNADGTLTPGTSLTIPEVTSGSGNNVSVSGDFVFYTPSTPANSSLATFSYNVSNGSSTDTGTVTVTTIDATLFTLDILSVVTPPAFNGTSTSVTIEFAGVPNQIYQIEYSTTMALNSWSVASAVATGTTGTFNATFTQTGNVAADWISHLYFRTAR